MKYEAFGKSDVGLVRANNEDSFLINEDLDLFVVADGMGGYEKGEVASLITCESIDEYIKEIKNNEIAFAKNQFKQAVFKANSNIRKKINDSPGLDKMGSTVVSLIIRDDKVYVLNVGDSRAYVLRDKRLKQISIDHSLIQETKAAGIKKELPNQFKNIVTRAVGMKDVVEPDVYSLSVKDGDVLLLSSDGLHGYVNDDVIQNILNHNDNDMNLKLDKLINAAKKEGGKDNITCILIKIVEGSKNQGENLSETIELPTQNNIQVKEEKSISHIQIILIVLFFLIVIGLIFFLVK